MRYRSSIENHGTRRRVAARVLSVAAIVAIGGAGAACRAGDSPDVKSIDEVIALIPKDEARDLEKKKKQDEAARTLSTRLQEALRGKSATLELELDWWRPWTEYKGSTVQLRPVVHGFRVGGVEFGMELWVYFGAGSHPELQKLKKGDKFKTSAKFDEVRISTSQGPRLHINLNDASIVPR